MTQTRPDILLVGAGNMAADYAKVLAALDLRPQVLGRGATSAATFTEGTGLAVSTGPLADQLAALPAVPDTAIVTVNAMYLAEATADLIRAGVKRVLVEKPAGLDLAELETLCAVATQHKAEVYVGYNRRFMASVLRAQDMVAEDGGILSVKFDFSEPSRRIAQIAKPQRELDTWFYGNSSHVVDMAFHFFGTPVRLDASVTGSVSWHAAGAVFTGHAQSATNALMSWHANWLSPGRWGVEVMTPERRLIFQPLEELRVQSHKGFDAVPEPLSNQLDVDFKPGLMRQVRAFLWGELADRLQPLSQHAQAMQWYEMIRCGGSLDRKGT